MHIMLRRQPLCWQQGVAEEAESVIVVRVVAEALHVALAAVVAAVVVTAVVVVVMVTEMAAGTDRFFTSCFWCDRLA
jgi:hypothetical protein